jgi:hypothetical protein
MKVQYLYFQEFSDVKLGTNDSRRGSKSFSSFHFLAKNNNNKKKNLFSFKFAQARATRISFLDSIRELS